ncbi:tape measure protein [Siphonobacter sp. SORGH_AS_1065]|uniref:tape measure protein n=1 Tax=Siphonobacter sp. SORGH_AS_1065 TaxID=3041795 RepID=UPI00277DA488|nr:tape measure protein [Siphonobacter sp. SORGH_AS_1065]MDQ1087181.1 tape measure domain-containing protein [Siphonobacter sp. SORGH_AS_1065]
MDEDIRLRLQAVMEGGKAVEEQLRAILTIEKQLIEAAKRQEEAAKARTEAAKARAKAQQDEASREKGILESLQAKYAELQKARQRAMSMKEVRELNQQLSQLERQMQQVTATTVTLGKNTASLSGQFRSLQTLAAAAFSITALSQFASKIKDVTSNNESFQISLETMLDSKAKADSLNREIIDLAKRTPFTLGEVQEQTNKLLAYGIASEDVTKTIEELGNIAAGVGKEKLPFLTLAYGQVRSLGRLTGQEVRQFTEAGVPLLELLAKQSGKTTAQIQKDVSDGAVSFEMVKQAIASTSVEGGKFFNLMEKQSTTIQGRLSNFSDNVDQGLIRVGNRFKDTGLSIVSTVAGWVEGLIGSESAVSKTIASIEAIITAYLSYRATLIAVTIQSRLNQAADLGLVGTQRLLLVATGQLNTAQKGLWATMRANPIGLITAAIGIAVTAYQAWQASSVEVTSSLGEEEKKIRAERDTLIGLVSAIKDSNISNDTRTLLIKKLKKEYPDLLKGLNTEVISNQALDTALKQVIAGYNERIRLARIAYAVEQNQGKRKGLFDQENESIEKLKKEFPQAKITALDLAGAIAQVRSQVRDTSAAFEDENGVLIKRVDRLTKYENQLRGIQGEMQKLTDVEIEASAQQAKIEAEAEKRRDLSYQQNLKRRKELQGLISGAKDKVSIGDHQELVLIDREIKAYEEAHRVKKVIGTKTDKDKKKWHNDELTRELAERKAMDESLQKALLINNTEERIAESKAVFEEKTAAEIELIHAEYEEKRLKIIETYRKKRQDVVDDERKRISDGLDKVAEHELKIQQDITEAKRKEIEKQTKLDLEYQKLLGQQARVRQEITLESRRATELENAKSFQQQLAIERKYDNDLTAIRVSSLNEQILRETFRVNTLKSKGLLTVAQEKESRNKILQLEIEIDEAKEQFNKKDADRQKQAADRRRQVERETAQMIIQLLGQSENAYMKGFASILVAHQQYKDKVDKREAKTQDAIILGITAMSAASSAFFSAEKQKYEELAQAAADRHAAEMKALDEKNQADLNGFVGNEAQKKQLQARQDKEKKQLQEKQNKELAKLKLQAWKADQAAAISQTLTAGLIAGVQAYVAATGDPIRGSIYAGIIGTITGIAVGKIAKQKPPKFYRTGTEFVDDKREYPRGIDTVPAMLTRGESVMTVEENERKRALGLTNPELLALAERRMEWERERKRMIERMNSDEFRQYQPVVSYHHFALEGKPYTKPVNPNRRTEELLETVSRKLDKLDNIQQTNLHLDRSGFTLYILDRLRKLTIHDNRYNPKR